MTTDVSAARARGFVEPSVSGDRTSQYLLKIGVGHESL